MSLQGIRLVTFDATNTLLKFRVSPWVYYTQVARGYGFKGTEQQVHQRFYENYKLVWKYYPNFGSDTIGWRAWWKHVIKRTFREHYELAGSLDKLSDQLIEDFKTSKCWTPAYAAPELIKNLRNRNISIGIISNFDPRLHNVLDEVGFDRKNFEFVLTSYAAKCMKPNPEIFDLALKACSRLNMNNGLSTEEITAAEALHIGDDYENDYCAARYAGWKSALIYNDKPLNHPFEAESMFKSLAHLNDFLINRDKIASDAIPVLEPIIVTPPTTDVNKNHREQEVSKASTIDTHKMNQEHSDVHNEVPYYTANMKLDNTPKMAHNCIVANEDSAAHNCIVANEDSAAHTMQMRTNETLQDSQTNYTGTQYGMEGWMDGFEAQDAHQRMTPNYTTPYQPMHGYGNTNKPEVTYAGIPQNFAASQNTQSQKPLNYPMQWCPNLGNTSQNYNSSHEHNNQGQSNQNFSNQNTNKQYSNPWYNNTHYTNK